MAAAALLGVLLCSGCAEVRQVTEFIRGEPPLVGGQPVNEIAYADETPLDRKLTALWLYLSGASDEGKVVEEDELGPLPYLDPVPAETADPAPPPESVVATKTPEPEPEPEAVVQAPQQALAVDASGCPTQDELSRFRFESARRALQVRSVLAARREGKQISLSSCR